MAQKPVKFFTWHSLERILTSVARNPPETEDEYLAWLRAIHLFSLSVFSVFRTSSNLLNFAPRSPLGDLAYKTFIEVAGIYQAAVGMFPQEELQELVEILEEVVVPLPAPD